MIFGFTSIQVHFHLYHHFVLRENVNASNENSWELIATVIFFSKLAFFEYFNEVSSRVTFFKVKLNSKSIKNISYDKNVFVRQKNYDFGM